MHQGRHLENLNAPQKDAVQHHQGPILVLAGAGTGKTRILTRRIAHLILEHKARPSSIFAVTFTNKACGEMRERLELILGNVSHSIWISTFHSAGLRILRRHADLLGYGRDFNIYDASDSKDVVKRIVKQKNIDEKKFPPSMFHSYIDSQKNIPKFPEDLGKGASLIDSLKIEVFDLYQRALREANAFDFGDLLAQTWKLFKKHPSVLRLYQESLDFILVDEFQDTNLVQYEIIRMMAGEKKNLLVVGDDDQSIYAFRGASVQNILDFEKDFGNTKVVKLEQNYRSTETILESAHAVIVKNKNRKDKKLWTASDKGEPIRLFCGADETEEAYYIAQEIRNRVDGGLTYNDIAVFYRTNAQSRAIEEAFLNFRIPYKIFGGLKFYDRKEVKDVIAYLRLISNRSDNQAYLRVINTPTRGIGAQTIQQIIDEANTSGVSFYEASERFAHRNKNIAKFVNLIEELKSSYRGKSLFDLLSDVIEKAEYGPRLRAMANDPQAESRLENLKELQGLALSFELLAEQDPLQQFLDRIALTTSEETPTDGNREAKDTVSLMTLHLAKGLEFDIVFFTGFEEGLLPHYRSMYDPSEVDEERRLCYVGMTRARHSLFVTRTRQRGLFSAGGGESSRFREPSRFAFDIPKTLFNDLKNDFFISASPDDFNDSLSFDKEEDALSSGFSTLSKRVQKIERKPSTSNVIWGLVKSADSMTPQNEDLSHLPLLPIDAAQEGRPVLHPSFGAGIIEATEGDSDEKNGSFKVIIKFEKFPHSKKLVFRFAGLREDSPM